MIDQQTRAILDLVASHESDSSAERQGVESGYDVVLNGAKRPPKPLTQMTIGEVMAHQQAMIGGGAASGAVGRYQVIPKTMRWAVNKLGLSPDDLYDAETQDRIGVALLERRGLKSFRDGHISKERFANNLSKEWAALPLVTGPKAGQSYYAGVAGNRAGVRPSQVLGALGGAAPANSPVEPPDPPGPLGASPAPGGNCQTGTPLPARRSWLSTWLRAFMRRLS